jgi:hypothetical protein
MRFRSNIRQNREHWIQFDMAIRLVYRLFTFFALALFLFEVADPFLAGTTCAV